MDNEAAKLTLSDQQVFDDFVDKIERRASGHRFDELLSVASTICLKNTLPDIEPRQLTPNQQIIGKYGLMGLRTAIEMDMGIEYGLISDNGDMQFDSILRLPPETHDQLDYTIAAKVEQFGKVLIEESYTVLGDDADGYVEHMRSGDVERQREAVSWLMVRIHKIIDEGDNADRSYNSNPEDNVYHYHPVRLSPKVIGRYPDIEVEPTCLGASMLVASFCEKAGVPYMHAGTAMNAGFKQAVDLMGVYYTVRNMFDHPGSDIDRPAIVDSISDNMQALRDSITNTGHHAAVIVRLADEQWYTVDGLLRNSGILKEHRPYQMSEIYNTLEEFRDDAPGLTVSHEYDGGALEYVLLHLIGQDKFLLSGDILERAVSVLQSGAVNAVDIIYEQFVKPLYYVNHPAGQSNDMESASESAEGYLDFVMNYNDNRSDGNNDLARDSYDPAFSKYVLWGDKPENVARRMQTDARYRADRVQDLRTLPILMAVNMAGLNLTYNVFGATQHASLELALPHSNIGYATLSHFDSYRDDPLLPSFWMAQWSSLTTIAESLKLDHNKFQADLVDSMAKWSLTKRLNYVEDDVMIRKFLTKRNEVDEDVH